MKKYGLICVLLCTVLAVSNCGPSGSELSKGSSAYQLAEKFSQILPELAPEKNKVLVSSKHFKITSGDVISSIVESPGTDFSQFDHLDEAQLRSALEGITDNLMKRKLILRAALKSDYSCSQEELDALYTTFVERFNGEKNFESELNRIELSPETFKKALQDGIIRQKYIDDIILAAGSVSEEQLQKAYSDLQSRETATVRHLLLRTDGKSVAEKERVLEKMKALRRRAVRGEDFASLVMQYSEEPDAAETGGLYENFSRGDMVEAFDRQVFSLAPGQISEIFETAFGYHILKVIDRQGATETLEAIREDFEQQVREYKQAQALDIEIARLKIEADVKIMSF